MPIPNRFPGLMQQMAPAPAAPRPNLNFVPPTTPQNPTLQAAAMAASKGPAPAGNMPAGAMPTGNAPAQAPKLSPEQMQILEAAKARLKGPSENIKGLKADIDKHIPAPKIHPEVSNAMGTLKKFKVLDRHKK